MSHRATIRLKKILTSTSLFRLINPRKTHIYCVGTAKSGTHSIAAIFDNHLRSAHEPESNVIIDLILERAANRLDDKNLCHYLRKRDKELWLDIDSSQLNFFLHDVLVKLFPDAKFILTIRNPYTWLDSFINHQLSQKGSQKWNKLRDLRFRPDIYTHSQEEQIFAAKGLYTLDGYLSYWAHHNQTVIDTIPKNRLLIVRTDKISESTREITKFSGVLENSLQQDKTHTFKAKEKFHLLENIDQEYLKHKVKQHCDDLLTQFFPEIQS